MQYNYDLNGNRTVETAGQDVTNYTYSPNKLISSAGAKPFTFGYDSNGNTVLENQRQYIYNQNQRLIQAKENGSIIGEYVYNGNGQRVMKTTPEGTVIFHYDLRGQLLAESTATGALTTEYVFLNGNPFAKIEDNNVYYYHNDHLATPQKMTDSSGAVVWSADYKPFGEATVTISTITNNLRFPGQYYDEETGVNYNYYRDYNPIIGRYVEADPIGIKGGINLFIYVGANPVSLIDYYGLDANTFAYGEIRECAITSPRNFAAPDGLGDAKASICAACSRGNLCKSVDGSTASAQGDIAAWRNILGASGTDRSGGGNVMCVGNQNCFVVHKCAYCCGSQKKYKERGTNLTPTGIVNITTTNSTRCRQIFFYRDDNAGWCPGASRNCS